MSIYTQSLALFKGGLLIFSAQVNAHRHFKTQPLAASTVYRRIARLGLCSAGRAGAVISANRHMLLLTQVFLPTFATILYRPAKPASVRLSGLCLRRQRCRPPRVRPRGAAPSPGNANLPIGAP